MEAPETVLVVQPDGSAATVAWPPPGADRTHTLQGALRSDEPRMMRCGKGILGFSGAAAREQGMAPNPGATAAFAAAGIDLPEPLHGPVLFARNPSKGSVVKALTAAQAANLLVVTGARLSR